MSEVYSDSPQQDLSSIDLQKLFSEPRSREEGGAALYPYVEMFLEGFDDPSDIKSLSEMLFWKLEGNKEAGELMIQRIISIDNFMNKGTGEAKEKRLEHYLHAITVMNRIGSVLADNDGSPCFEKRYDNGLTIRLPIYAKQTSVSPKDAKDLESVSYSLTFIFEDPKKNTIAGDIIKTFDSDVAGPHYPQE